MDRIIFVDSSDSGSDIIPKYLARNGFDVMHAPDGIGISLKLKIAPPDLIIIDEELKRGSGYDLCKSLKESGESGYIPILIMCSGESVNSQQRAIASGADDFMVKSLEHYVLLSKVKSLLRIKRLSDQLKNQYIELQDKDRMLDLQLKMAMQVQRSLIQEYNITHNGVKIVSKYLPALDIGGDFYDIIKLNDELVAVVIGDVSGHGISAALLTAMLNMMVRNFAPLYFNPAQFLFHMNNEFINIFENRNNEVYACIFYALINTKKGRIYYSNAGQALPIHLKSGGTTELDSSGTPVGMMRDSVYEHRIATFAPGDLLFFYTDGLSDNFDKQSGDEFYTKISAILMGGQEDGEQNALQPEVILERIMEAFFDENSVKNKYELDDVSLIVCKL